MPATIVATIVLLIAAAGFAGLLAVNAYEEGQDPAAFVCGVLLVCSLLGALGVWRGWELGRTLAVVVGVGAVLAGANVEPAQVLAASMLGYAPLGLVFLAGGAVLIGAAVVPQSSRDWFR